MVVITSVNTFVPTDKTRLSWTLKIADRDKYLRIRYLKN